MKIRRVFIENGEPIVEWDCSDCGEAHQLPLEDFALMALQDILKNDMPQPMAVDEDTTEVDYDDIEHETDAAVMFLIDNRLVWLPKSQISFDRDELTIELPVWLATEKGLV